MGIFINYKLIFQSAWTLDAKVAGLCEISIVTPDSMLHNESATNCITIFQHFV